MAKRKYTRKQLRQPDEFISFSMRVWELIRANGPRVIVMLVVAVLIIAGVWTWTYFSDKRGAAATKQLSRAFDIYNQTVLPMETKLPDEDEDGIPRFKSREKKLKAAQKAFGEAAEKASGDLEGLAVLMRAGVHFDRGELDEAIKDYQKYLQDAGAKPFLYSAREALGYCYEAKKDYDKALEQFRKLKGEGEQKWVAKYHEGRILARQGKSEQAAKLLGEVAENAESTMLKDYAGDQLALIEAK